MSIWKCCVGNAVGLGGTWRGGSSGGTLGWQSVDGWGKSEAEPGWVGVMLRPRLSKSGQNSPGGGALRDEVSHCKQPA